MAALTFSNLHALEFGWGKGLRPVPVQPKLFRGSVAQSERKVRSVSEGWHENTRTRRDDINGLLRQYAATQAAEWFCSYSVKVNPVTWVTKCLHSSIGIEVENLWNAFLFYFFGKLPLCNTRQLIPSPIALTAQVTWAAHRSVLLRCRLEGEETVTGVDMWGGKKTRSSNLPPICRQFDHWMATRFVCLCVCVTVFIFPPELLTWKNFNIFCMPNSFHQTSHLAPRAAGDSPAIWEV